MRDHQSSSQVSRKTVRSLKWHILHPLNQRRPIRRDGIGIIPFFAGKRLHDLSQERVFPVMQHHAQFMPHTVQPQFHQHSVNTKYGKGRKGEVCSSPCANEHPAIELRRNRRLVLLDVTRDLVRFVFPALLGDRLDALELERVRVDPFLQAFDLVDGEPVVSDEEVAHGDVQVTLALAVPEGHTGKSAAR